MAPLHTEATEAVATTLADDRTAALHEIRALVQQVKNVANSVDLPINDTTTLGMLQQAQDYHAFLPQH